MRFPFVIRCFATCRRRCRTHFRARLFFLGRQAGRLLDCHLPQRSLVRLIRQTPPLIDAIAQTSQWGFSSVICLKLVATG